VITENRGGGVSVRGGASADFVMDDTQVTLNQLSDGRGAGLQLYEVSVDYSTRATADITNSLIADNQNSQSEGGGIYIFRSGIRLVNSTIRDNSATNEGGGVYAIAQSSCCTASLENTSVYGNFALYGSAVHAEGHQGNYPFAIDARCTIGGAADHSHALLGGDGACPSPPLYHSLERCSGAAGSGEGTRLYGTVQLGNELPVHLF